MIIVDTRPHNTLRVMSTRLTFRPRILVRLMLIALSWTYACNWNLLATEPISAVAFEDNAILSDGSVLELIFTRQAKLNSGLTEGPAVAPDGSIYFTDMPFGNDNGMILRFDPKTSQTTVFANNSGKCAESRSEDAVRRRP